MTTTKTKTTEELVIDEYLYIVKLAKVYDSIVLPTELFHHDLQGNYGNMPTIDRLRLTHWAKQRQSSKIHELTGINLELFRDKFLKSELQKSGQFINLNLLSLTSNSDE